MNCGWANGNMGAKLRVGGPLFWASSLKRCAHMGIECICGPFMCWSVNVLTRRAGWRVYVRAMFVRKYPPHRQHIAVRPGHVCEGARTKTLSIKGGEFNENMSGPKI